MSNIDKQRVAAVWKLEQLGYTFTDDWASACRRDQCDPSVSLG